jgi:CBS domain-containing protein
MIRLKDVESCLIYVYRWSGNGKDIVRFLETTIKEAAEILATMNFMLSVCDNEVLMGMVTTTDLMSYLLDRAKRRNIKKSHTKF